MSRRRWLVAGVAAGLLGVSLLVAWGLLTRRSSASPPALSARDSAAMAGLPPEARTPAARRGEASASDWLEIPAPVVSFRALDGDTVSLADYRGKVVVLNFWGTWCPPCRREIPELEELQRSLRGSDATVVGIAIDSGTRARVRDWAEAHAMSYPIWLGDTDTAVRYYQTMGFPTTLLVDRKGVIRRRYLGPQTRAGLLRDLAHLGVRPRAGAASATSGPGASSVPGHAPQPPASNPT